MTLELVLTSSLVSALVTAILGPAIFYILKTKEDRKRRQFEIKFGEFKHYLRALEQISRFSGEELEKYMSGPAQKCMESILTGREDSNQALVNMNREMNEFVLRLTKSFQQSSSELHGLRLICSSELFGMVNDFVGIQDQIMTESIALMGQIKLDESGSVVVPIDSDLRRKGEASKQMFARIVEQMRSELGTDEP